MSEARQRRPADEAKRLIFMKRVMVFGTFDGIHEGHRHFLREAKEMGDYLIAVVATDEVVRTLKGKSPKYNLSERIEHVEDEDGVNKVVAGDLEMGSWEIVQKMHPDVVAIGYDQKILKENLEDYVQEFGWFLEVETVSAHKPEKYHSSLLNS